MDIILGSDHAGFDLKMICRKYLEEKTPHTVKDAGVYDKKSADYPDIAHAVAKAVESGEFDRGILICGTGLGMSMTANRHRNIRAALCYNSYAARMSRLHNDANILAMGERVLGSGLAIEILDVFLETPFEGGRHQKRIIKID